MTRTSTMANALERIAEGVVFLLVEHPLTPCPVPRRIERHRERPAEVEPFGCQRPHGVDSGTAISNTNERASSSVRSLM